jgi:hypothetical protein
VKNEGSAGSLDLGRRLDVLIFLQLDEKYPSVAEKIVKLAEAGLNSGEIGSIVDRKANYVTATLAQRKKRKKNAKLAQ